MGMGIVLKMHRCLAGLLCAAWLSTAPVAVAAPVSRVSSEPSRAPAPAAPEWRMPDYPEAWTATLEFEPLAPTRIEAVRQRNATTDKAVQVGIARMADAEAAVVPARLHWVRLPDGGSVARLRVASPDALALRLGLRVDALDHRMELRFSGSRDPATVVAQVVGARARQLADREGVYWTPVTDGDQQTIELYAPSGASIPAAAPKITAASHFLATSRTGFRMQAGSQACQVDAVCRVAELGPAYVAAKDAVARMAFTNGGASFVCTGTLLNDTDPATQVPYFHTANHCVSWQHVANTVVTAWGYEAASCGSTMVGDFEVLQGGAEFLHGDEWTDTALLRLNAPAPANATFSGWSVAPVAGDTDVIGIHHPAGDVKKVSSGVTVEAATNAYLRGASWLVGSTEPGSSGSGLFVREGGEFLLVGGLLGGSSSCDSAGDLAHPDNLDFYSRFDTAFPYLHRFISAGVGNGPPLPDFDFTADRRTAWFVDDSVDHDGAIVSRKWDFGDGTTSTAIHPRKTWAADGTYVVTLTATDDKGASLSKAREVHVASQVSPALRSGAGVSFGAATGEMFRYTFSVPPHANFVHVQLVGGEGDADLYVKRNAPPTPTAFDCRANSADSIETCSVSQGGPGLYHILVVAYEGFGDVGLTASYRILDFKWRSRAAHDFDGDDASDIFWRHAGSGANAMWRSASDKAYAPVRPVTDVEWHVAAVGDFDGDARADLFWRHAATGATAVWPAGDPTSVRSAGGVADPGWSIVGVGDFNGDADEDLLWRHAVSGGNLVWLSADSSTVRLLPGVATSWEVVGVGDFEGDLRHDILWRHAVTGANVVWRDGDNNLRRRLATITDADWEVVAIGRFDADFNEDVLWRHRVNGSNVIWRSASFSDPIAMIGIRDRDWRIVAAGDYDGDGIDDILWRHAASGRNTIWNHADHTWQTSVATVDNLGWTIVD